MSLIFLCGKSTVAIADRMVLKVAWMHKLDRRDSYLVKPAAAWMQRCAPLARKRSTITCSTIVP